MVSCFTSCLIVSHNLGPRFRVFISAVWMLGTVSRPTSQAVRAIVAIGLLCDFFWCPSSSVARLAKLRMAVAGRVNGVPCVAFKVLIIIHSHAVVASRFSAACVDAHLHCCISCFVSDTRMSGISKLLQKHPSCLGPTRVSQCVVLSLALLW